MGKGAGQCADRPSMQLVANVATVAGADTRVCKLKRDRSKKQYKPGTYTGQIERTTHKGIPVTLNLYREIDDNINDGWIVDLVEAHTAQGPAGSLKISFIPTEHMQRVFPNAFEYAVRQLGKYGGLQSLLETPEASWTRADVTQALSKVDGWLPYQHQDRVDTERAQASEPELWKLWEQRRAKIEDEEQEGYQRFCSFHRDRPLVDYIRVNEPHERQIYADGRRIHLAEPLGYSCQRQGIGTLLYETGAMWMHQRGMTLHGSGNQSDEASAVWSGFEQQGLVQTTHDSKKDRRSFDVQALYRQKPELARVLDHIS